MVMNPQEIENAEFRSAFRGYDKPQVRAFLRRTAKDLAALQAELDSQLPIEELLQESSGEGAPGEQVEVEEISADGFDESVDSQELESSIDDVLEEQSPEGSEFEASEDVPSEEALGERALDEEIFEPHADDGLETSLDLSEGEYELAVDGETVEYDVDSYVDGPTPVVSEDHRFQALGDRIAGLLKSAHESATHLRDTAQHEAVDQLNLAKSQGDAIRAEAEADAEEIRAAAELEADEIRARSEVDADRLKTGIDELNINSEAVAQEVDESRAQALLDVDEELQSKRDAAEALSSAAQADRDQAMVELADARGQVTELLGQARSQSDFIRHEADEVIRARVRRNMEQAEERLNVLRNSEIASRERIIAAHRELEGAMARLDLDAAPVLPTDPEQYALDGARERAEASNFGELETNYEDLDSAADAADLENSSANEAGQASLPRLGDEPASLESDSAKDPIEVIEVGEFKHADFDAPLADIAMPAGSFGYENSESSVEPADEDALGRLVRQAMEQAVDSARSAED